MTEEKTIIDTIGYRRMLSPLQEDFLRPGPGDSPKGAREFGIGAEGLGERTAAQ